jgi:hypothetical protein
LLFKRFGVINKRFILAYLLMTKSFKKRWKIIQDEILNKKWNRIYSESSIKKVIKNRYKYWEIKTNNSYVYQKMNKLLDRKVFIEVRNIPKEYASSCWYVNVFDLHKELTHIIELYHMPKKNSKIYTEEERKYMNDLKNYGMIK